MRRNSKQQVCDLCRRRKVTIIRKVRKYSSKSARRGRPASLTGHDLCYSCWKAFMQRNSDSVDIPSWG